MTYSPLGHLTRPILVTISLCITHLLFAQSDSLQRSSGNLATQPDSTGHRVTYGQVEVGGLFSSSGTTPYWIQTNQYGIVPKSAPTALAIASIQSGYRTGQRKIDWGYGLQVAGQGGAANHVILAEAYLKGRLGIFELTAGRRKQRVGLAESPLSSGSYIWSGNALPVPRIELSIPEYAPIGFTRGFVALKGFFAHGWFGDDPYVKRSYLHQKALYIRLGKPQARVRLYGAFTHYAQWAGYAPFLESDPTSSFSGQIANSLEAYLYVVLPLKTDALLNRAKFTTYDENRVGDHRGSAEAAVEVRLNHGSLFLYQQHFYDLGRKLYNLSNIEDGLYGLRFQDTRPRRLFQDVVVELFNSGSQGIITLGKANGGDFENYFLNGQYPTGWSYKGRTIGTPFMSQTADVNPQLPSVPFSGTTLDNQLIVGTYGINNNRVWALHTGLSGSIGSQWGYVVKASYSKNYGTYTAHFPYKTNQLSTLLSLTRATPWFSGSTLLLSAGYDQGKLFPQPQQVGGYIGLRKSWVSRPHL